jgi:predicted nucleic acid-binding protein
MNVFFDSSAWAKRYIDEKGSEEVVRTGNSADEITLSILCIPELISAFSRLKREGKISNNQYIQLRSALLADIADVQLVNISEEIINRTIILLENHALRTPDALHLACFDKACPDLFVTADHRQYEAAKHLGMNVQFVGRL